MLIGIQRHMLWRVFEKKMLIGRESLYYPSIVHSNQGTRKLQNLPNFTRVECIKYIGV
jgi:hypothetical protein